jgi:hypothetical protein
MSSTTYTVSLDGTANRAFAVWFDAQTVQTNVPHPSTLTGNSGEWERFIPTNTYKLGDVVDTSKDGFLLVLRKHKTTKAWYKRFAVTGSGCVWIPVEAGYSKKTVRTLGRNELTAGSGDWACIARLMYGLTKQ